MSARWRLQSLSIWCALQLFCVLAASAQAPELPERAQAAIGNAVARHMRDGRIPGLSLAIGRDGQVVFAKGYGIADLEHEVPVTPATLFRLQSTQKLLTATAVLRMAELGRLRLDDSIQRYCPSFGVRPLPVTVGDLLTHQGGVRPSDPADLFNQQHYPSTETAVRRFARDTLAYQPGTRVLYSNAGYTLLACAVEGVTREPYDSAITRLVLRPSGMTATRDDNMYEVIPGRARYYVVRTASNTEQWRGLWTDGHLAATRLDQPANADPVDPSWAAGAGNYLGTPTDLVRFGLALVAGRLLHAPWRDTAFADAPLRLTGEPTGRSLGGWVRDPDGGHLARMLGSTWNGSFGLGLDTEDGIVVAIASNIEFDQPAELAGELVELVRASRLPAPPPP